MNRTNLFNHIIYLRKTLYTVWEQSYRLNAEIGTRHHYTNLRLRHAALMIATTKGHIAGYETTDLANYARNLYKFAQILLALDETVVSITASEEAIDNLYDAIENIQAILP